MNSHRLASLVLLVLVVASGLTSLGSYCSASRMVDEDMDRALSLAMMEQQGNIISQDTIRTFNSHLQIAELRGRATLVVDTRGRQFTVSAHCSEATIFSLSDQRPAALLWVLTGLWGTFVWYRRRQSLALSPQLVPAVPGNAFGGLSYSEAEGRFYTTEGTAVRLTPMQQQLMELLFRSPSHSMSKSEICEALWPKKPDASETLYTLVRRLKPVVEQHSQLAIESDRSRSYRLTVKEIGN